MTAFPLQLSQYSLDLDSGASVIGVMEGECGQGMWDWVPVGSCGCCKGMMGLLASSHVNISLYFKLIYLLLAGVRGVAQCWWIRTKMKNIFVGT